MCEMPRRDVDPSPPTSARRASAAARGAVVAFALSGCTFGATEVRVVLGTDAPPERTLTIVASVYPGSSTSGPVGATATHAWSRGGDAGSIRLPADFAVTPGARSTSSIATLVITAHLASNAPSEPTIEFRRVARFAFTPHVATILPVFLAVACGNPSTACTTAGARCTVSQRCEEMGTTCGDDGTCIPIAVTLPALGDGGIDVVFPGPREAGVDASDVRDATDAVEAVDAVDVVAPPDVVPCPAGSFVNTSASCVPCAPGSYCPGNETSIPCAAGTYQPSAGQTSCIACPAGSYTNTMTAAGATACVRCPSGSYCPGNGNRRTCPSGQGAPPGSSASSECGCNVRLTICAMDCSNFPAGCAYGSTQWMAGVLPGWTMCYPLSDYGHGREAVSCTY